eukprot:1958678-Amphidinium_carterae.1
MKAIANRGGGGGGAGGCAGCGNRGGGACSGGCAARGGTCMRYIVEPSLSNETSFAQKRTTSITKVPVIENMISLQKKET